MSRPTDRPTGRVELGNEDHVADMHSVDVKGADSVVGSPAHPSSEGRVGRIALNRLRSLLSERDIAITTSVDEFRYLTGRQLNRLHFHNHASEATAARTARSVLNRLVAGRLLRRTERRIGGIRGGSSSYVYGIGPVGHRMLHDDGSRGRWDEPSTTFLEHTLAVAELAIGLEERTRNADAANRSSLQMQTEPSCWRGFTLGLGGREVLKPDLFVALQSEQFEDLWFVEMDMATESSTAIHKKCQIYIDYHRSGIEQQRHDVFPRVLWVVPTDKRARQLQQVIDRLHAPDGLLAVVTSSDAVAAIVGDVDGPDGSAGGQS